MRQYIFFLGGHCFHWASDYRRPFWAWTVVCCGILSVFLALRVVWTRFCFEIRYVPRIVDLEMPERRCRPELLIERPLNVLARYRIRLHSYDYFPQ
ncbi:hypothetical protein HanRHA438_Chr17g0835621 [Helianthus annuus]|nr:hypothetical protein HanRHA438_Chr17g0835621 [Helianthus annuus]